MRKKIVALTFSFLFPFTVFAQTNRDVNPGGGGPGRHMQTIVFAGVAGAILGLSTLSFYGRPQDKLSHIAIGAAFGIITGTVYTTYKAATEPKDFYSLRENGPSPELWQMNLALERTYTPSANFTFEF